MFRATARVTVRGPVASLRAVALQRHRHLAGQAGRGVRAWLSSLNWTPIPIGLGVAYIGYQQLGHVLERERQQAKKVSASAGQQGSEPWPAWAVAVYRTLPDRFLSRCWGTVNKITLPGFLRRPLLGLYASAFGCDLEEAREADLKAYPHLQAFFTRHLRPGLRPIAPAAVVSPADCRVLHCGRVSADAYGQMDHVEQVKNISYSLADLVGFRPPRPKPGNALFHCTLYLAPGDYHHFHSPVDWQATELRHFPGDLMSVSPMIARLVPGLFRCNERVSLTGEWEQGWFAFVAVGAYNVGAIVMDATPSLRTNRNKAFSEGSHDLFVLPDSTAQRLHKGDHVGGFQLGSSIVLVFEAAEDFAFYATPGEKLKYGQALGSASRRSAAGA